MPEKDYSGAATSKIKKTKAVVDKSKKNASALVKKQKISKQNPDERNETDNKEKINQELKDYKKAGEISVKVKEYARSIIKKDMLLREIAEKIDKKIEELGGQLAFPVNLSINEIAAHYHPTLEDETKAEGLLKIDLGIQINGYIADTAFSLDLSENQEHKELIKSSEDALESSLKLLEKNPNSTLSEIGQTIQKTIEARGFSPIINLSGHGLQQYEIHASPTIPNYANNNENKLNEGAYAIEPFATTGEGKIYEGAPSNIYAVVNPKNTRGPTARKILEYVWEKYQTLPFSMREVQMEFGAMARLAMKELEQNNIIHSFPQLIEKSHKPVSQAEHTFIKKNNEIIITTKSG